MFKQFVSYVQKLLLLTEETRRNRVDIDDLYTRLERLEDKIHVLAGEIPRIAEREQHEREKLVLKLENVLLRFERLLPPPSDPQKRS